MKRWFAFALGAAALLGACREKTPALTASGLDPQSFAATVPPASEGEPAYGSAAGRGGETALYVLRNAAGMEACITNFGARLVSLMVPDRGGVLRDVVLGFDNVASYIDNPSAFGAVMGRYANRIGGGRFTLDGREYPLPLNNNGVNCIHGGPRSWQYAVFTAEAVEPDRLVLSLISPDGEFGFPGEVHFTVTYALTAEGALRIDYAAESDAPTVFNVTNHSFFNLSGDPARPVLDHVLTVDADYITPTDERQVPTGERRPVAGTPFDFRSARPLGEGVASFEDPQIALAKGYDHNFVLNHPGDPDVPAAVCCCPATGIVLTVFTDQPGVQVYSANNLNGSLIGKGGIPLEARTAICLETQHFPDSPNHPDFPSTVLRPGRPFASTTVFAFSVAETSNP
ncbi:MAG: galactose mutarotase [Bacteroidales bacterium]|nr:galactose mutarotase [Bacteroidales bacterium]